MATFEKIRNGFEYEILVLDDQIYKFKVLVNYKGLDRHYSMWLSNKLDNAIDRAIEELHKEYPFEQIIFEYE